MGMVEGGVLMGRPLPKKLLHFPVRTLEPRYSALSFPLFMITSLYSILPFVIALNTALLVYSVQKNLTLRRQVQESDRGDGYRTL